jgi:small-conductance mechanosensitive channel
MDVVTASVEWLQNLLQQPLMSLGSTRVTLGTVLYVVLIVLVIWVGAGWLQRWLTNGPLLRTRLDASARHAVGTLTRYAIILIGLLVVVQTAGIDLTTLNVLAGALGLGIGFGLQTIVANFIAGLIIMFERPIKIGDRIVVGDTEGDVVSIGARGTTVVDNDGIAVIVPNLKFITENVINWKYSGNEVRFKIPVSVAYGSDVRAVEAALLKVAKADADILDNPAPAVRMMEFGDNGVHFELRAWTRTLTSKKGILFSNLNFAIYEAFNAEGIAFPFPQRDLHVKGGTLEIRTRPATDD